MKTKTKRTKPDAAFKKMLVESALIAMGFEAFEPRGRDALDFRDVHVQTASDAIRVAIEAALG